MLTTVRTCDMSNTQPDPKVVDLASFKKKLEQDQEVKLSNYTPCAQDITAFLRVLRYLQKKTMSEQMEVESNADGLTFSLTEFVSDTENSDGDNIDYTTISHKTFVPFPFMLVDLDPSELTVYDNGLNTVDLFSESIVHTLTSLQVKRK